MGRYQSGQLGQTVNLLSYDFAGSNPALPTRTLAGVTQLVECQPSKLNVAGSNPVARSIGRYSSGVEHFHGKEGVVSSILTRGSDVQHPVTRRGSSAGQSARLIIVRSRVRAPPPLRNCYTLNSSKHL